MPTPEDLPADQRAVLSLVLDQGHSYDEIAAKLSIDRAAVRDRARVALERIGPRTDVPETWRALLTDYLLGQLPAGVVGRVRERISTPGPERDWASAVATQLAPLSDGRLARLPALVGSDHAPGRGPARGPRSKPVSRRGGTVVLALGGLLALSGLAVGLVALVWGLGGSNGGSASTSTHAATTHRFATPFSSPPVSGPPSAGTVSTTPTTEVLDRLALLPPRPVARGRRAGIAEVVRAAGRTGIVIVAQGLAPNTRRNAYAVWLSGAAGASAFLGFVSQLVSGNGRLTADGAMPADASRYSTVLLTLETQSKPKLPGLIVLQGDLSLRG
jgi:hypothetical protein